MKCKVEFSVSTGEFGIRRGPGAFVDLDMPVKSGVTLGDVVNAAWFEEIEE